MSASVDAPETATATASPLRLGGRGLSPEVVAAEQRRRILAAVPAAVAGRGFDHTFVSHVIEGAGVSRPTFYEHFDNRQDVFRVAYDEGFEYLQAQIEVVCEEHGAWPQRVAAAIAAVLDFAVAEPLTASLLLVEPVASGADNVGPLLRLLGSVRSGPPPRAPPVSRSRVAAASDRADLAGALSGLIGRRLHTGEQASLPALAPQLTELVLTPYLGAVAARRIDPNKRANFRPAALRRI